MQENQQKTQRGKIVNITMKSHLQCNINLYLLSSLLPEKYCKFDENRFRGLICKLYKKFCFLIFPNGAVILTGVQDPEYGQNKMIHLIDFLISSGFNIGTVPPLQICNVVSAYKLNSGIDIAKFHKNNPKSILEFEQFPGCSFPVYQNNDNIKCICFYSGSFHIVGCKNVNDSLNAIEYVIPLLSMYCS